MRARWINVILLVVLTGFCLLVVVERKNVLLTTWRVSGNDSNGVAPLTAAEERDLARFLPQMLKWAVRWLIATITCEDDLRINIADEIKRYEGKQIEGKLFVSDDYVIIFFDAIHLCIRFKRLHQLGLSPPEFEAFCERSYGEYISKQQRRGWGWLIDAGVWQTQIEQFHVGALAEASRGADQWSEEKKELYASLLEVVKRQARFHCSPQHRTVRAKIPDFEVGDPWVVVLFDAPLGARPAMLIDFDRDVTSGAFRAVFAKDFGLPDELAAVEAAIKGQRMVEVEFDCDKLREEDRLNETKDLEWLSEDEVRSLAERRVEPEDLGIKGEVVVKILIDVDGRVVLAHAVAGPWPLRQAAVKAAYQWRFRPIRRKLAGELHFQFR